MRKTLLILIAAVATVTVAAVLGAGCGGAGEEPQAQAPAAPASEPAEPESEPAAPAPAPEPAARESEPAELVEVEPVAAETEPGGLGAVLSGVNYLNAAGFHDMAETLAEGTLEPRYLNTVRKTIAVMEGIAWPEALGEQGVQLSAELSALEAALAEEDVAKAAEAGEAVHGAQHAFAGEAVGTLTSLEAGGDLGTVLAGVNYVNAAGFHDMAEALAEGTLQPHYLGRVSGVIAVTEAIAWPEPIATDAASFLDDLRALETALADEKVKKAARAGEAVHGAQHAFAGEAVGALTGLEASGDVGTVLAGITYIDAAGFHEMAETLAEGTLEPHYLGRVQGVLGVAEAIPWPEPLAEVMVLFVNQLEALETALAEEDVVKAAEMGEIVHGGQHGLADGLLAVLSGDAQPAAADGHDEAAESQAVNTSAADDGQGLVIEMTDWAFEPGVIEVEPGPVTLTLINRGELPHGIYLSEFKVNEPVAAGETKVITFQANETGEFQFMCNEPLCGTVAQHAGMMGKLLVG